MKFVISSTLTASINKLDPQDQTIVKQAVFDFQVDPERPSFKFHRVDRTKDPNFWSIRANRDLRIIIHKTGDTNVLCYADHHDPAYDWARKRKLEKHSETGAAQWVNIDERVEEVIKRVVKEVETEPPLFEKYERQYLSALGVPEEFLHAAMHVTRKNFLDFLELLPDEASERLFDLADGKPVPTPPRIKGDAFEHPDALRRFVTVDSEEELDQALRAGWARWTVFLHPSQREAVEKKYNGPAKVSGGAGTGKTVVALHRAAHLARHDRGRVLLTTFSSTLAHRLAQNLELLLPQDDPARERVTILHLHKVARDLWVKYNKRNLKVVTKTRDLERHLSQASAGQPFDLAFLVAEFMQVVSAQNVRSWEEYRTVSRAGRGTPLSAKQRRGLWSVFERALESLGAAGLLTWDQTCHETAALLERHDSEAFAHVIADEVQDFGYADLVLLRALAQTGNDDLFLCGDPGQRIYKMRTSWLAAGVNVRGRATRLRVNYRTTEQIRDFATRLLKDSIEDGDGESHSKDTVSLLAGVDPEVCGFGSVGDEVSGVSEWLTTLLNQGCSPRDIAIFARTERILRDRAEPALEEAGLAFHYLEDGRPLDDELASLGTMHRAKGLEFKAVAVIGCEEGLVPLRIAIDSAQDPADKEAAREHERSLLYVASTRARDRLLLTYRGAPSEFLGEE